MMQLKLEPICRLSGRPATVVDHIDGNDRNNQPANLQSLCKPVHDWKTNIFEKRVSLAAIVNERTYLQLVTNNTDIKPIPVYDFFPQRYVCDIQFNLAFVSSMYYHSYDINSLKAWFEHALPVWNESKDQLKTLYKQAIEELLDTNVAGEPLRYVIESVALSMRIPLKFILRTACLFHVYEHSKQGANR